MIRRPPRSTLNVYRRQRQMCIRDSHTHAHTHRHARACINARVHSPVLTHHTHTQPPTQHEQPHAGHTEHTQTTLVSAPQTPNSMPIAKHFLVAHPPARNAGIQPAGMSPPGFLFNRQQLHTRQHQPPHTTTNKHKAVMHNKTNSLERRLSLIHISEPTRRHHVSRMPSSA